MKKYSEITLNDDERKLLEILKLQGYEQIGKELYPGEENHSGIYGRTRKGQQFLLLDWFNGFNWINYTEEYDIDKLLNPPQEPKTVWELEKGDEYWSVSAAGIVYKETWNNGCPDIDCRSQGNAFLTKEDAEFEVRRREVIAKVRKYARPFKVGNYNWFPCYDYNDDKIYKTCNVSCRAFVDYFDSEEAIDEAINEVGEDDFKKYYLGVTDDD